MSHTERYRLQRESMLRSATELAAEASPDQVQISQIVSLAGVSRKTFYEHFETKEACFAELLQLHARKIVQEFVAAAERELVNGPEATFGAILKSMVRHLGHGTNALFPYPLAVGLWVEGSKPESALAGTLAMVVDTVSRVFVVAARRLESPLDDDVLELAASVQVMGCIAALRRLDAEVSPVHLAHLSTSVAVSLGFGPTTARTAAAPRRRVAEGSPR